METSFFLLPLLFLFLLPEQATPATFTITNNCAYPVWPGLLSGAGTEALSTTGFLLNPVDSRTVDAPASWSGRLWGRTLCSTDASTNRFSCLTGDCGSSALECSSGAAPPATLAEFTLNGSGGMDFFDVSLVDGYNLPMLVVPQGGSGTGCSSTGCLVDLNGLCPSELRVVAAGAGGSVACRSACEAYGSQQYCCSGDYGGPNTCKPSAYSQFFKNACPRAYSYAYDDATSTFTCTAGAGYLITFCPSTTSLKSSGSGSGSSSVSGGNFPHAVGLPLINDTMVFLGESYESGGEMSRAGGAGDGDHGFDDGGTVDLLIRCRARPGWPATNPAACQLPLAGTSVSPRAAHRVTDRCPRRPHHVETFRRTNLRRRCSHAGFGYRTGDDTMASSSVKRIRHSALRVGWKWPKFLVITFVIK